MNSGINIRKLICRTCLKMHKDMFNLFEHGKNNKLISDILMDYTPIKVQKDDGFPVNICSMCLEKLNLMCDFRTMVIESNTRLYNFYCNDSNQELSNSCTSNVFTVKVEDTFVKCEEVVSVNNNKQIEGEDNAVSNIKNSPFIAKIKQNKLLIKDNENNMKETSKGEIKEDKNDDNVNKEEEIKMEISEDKNDDSDIRVDLSDDNSLSADLFVGSSSNLDNCDFKQQSKNKTIQKKIKREGSAQNIEITQDDEEIDTPLKSLDISEYEHLKTTLSRDERRNTRLFCKLCKKSYRFNYYFSIHLRMHIGDIPHKCNVCGKGFAQGSVLSQHMRIHAENKPYTCEVCDKSFKTPAGLYLHKAVHTTESPLTCVICNKQFKHKITLKMHLCRHNTERKYTCELCGKSYFDRANLYSHMKTHGTEQDYPCTECSKSFKSERALKDHIKRHSDERPFACSICNKRFKDKGVLDEHSVIHTGARPHACKICGKTFRQYSCIPRHMRIHTGETPFACEKCPSAFKYSHHLKNHMKVHNSV